MQPSELMKKQKKNALLFLLIYKINVKVRIINRKNEQKSVVRIPWSKNYFNTQWHT